MSVKLIALDMDGTLLTSDRQISATNKKAIAKAMEEGVVVTIASGRMFSSLKPFAEKLGIDVPIIACNGALIKNALSGKEIFSSSMDIALANEITNFFHEQGIYVQAYVEDELWVEKDCTFARYYADYCKVEFKPVGDELFHLTKGPHKLLGITEDDQDLDGFMRMIEKKFGGRIKATNSSDKFIDMNAAATSKWNGIMALARHYGIKREEIMCIGDALNDLDMVAGAGIGVAMGNAEEPLKQAAKIITADNDHDGVALAINMVLTKQVKVPEAEEV